MPAGGAYGGPYMRCRFTPDVTKPLLVAAMADVNATAGEFSAIMMVRKQSVSVGRRHRRSGLRVVDVREFADGVAGIGRFRPVREHVGDCAGPVRRFSAAGAQHRVFSRPGGE